MSALYTDDYLHPYGGAFTANPYDNPYKLRQNFTGGRYNEVSGPGGSFPWYDYAYGSFTDPVDATIKVKMADCQRQSKQCNGIQNTSQRVYCHQQNRSRGCFTGYVPQIDGNPNVQPEVMSPVNVLQANYYGNADYWNSPGYMGSAGRGTNLPASGIYRGNGSQIFGNVVQTQQQTMDNSVLTDQLNTSNMSHFSARSNHRMFDQTKDYSGSKHKRLSDGERFGSNSIDPAAYYVGFSAIGQKVAPPSTRVGARRLKMQRGDSN